MAKYVLKTCDKNIENQSEKLSFGTKNHSNITRSVRTGCNNIFLQVFRSKPSSVQSRANSLIKIFFRHIKNVKKENFFFIKNDKKNFFLSFFGQNSHFYVIFRRKCQNMHKHAKTCANDKSMKNMC